MVSLPLFVCLCVCYMCDDRITCVIREQMILQIILAWSRLTRGWGELGSFYNLLVVLNQILQTMKFSFVRNCYLYFSRQIDVLNYVI